MKHFVLVMFLMAIFLIYPIQTKAITMPCSLVLEPIDKSLSNAKGVGLVYKVKLTPSFPRTNVSILAVHLPEPSSIGDYDRYEGFAFIPNEISWRFTLYPSPEKEDPTWGGRIDDITAELDSAKVQVRLSNSKTKKLGPPILSNTMNKCH